VWELQHLRVLSRHSFSQSCEEEIATPEVGVMVVVVVTMIVVDYSYYY